MRKLIAVGSLSYFLIGLAMVLTGAVLEPVIAHYKLDYKEGSLWITSQFVGYLLGVLAAPMITSRIGKRSALVLAFGCLTVAEASYSMLGPWTLMLLIAPLAGLGFGMAEAIVGATIISLSDAKKASSMVLLEVFFGIGALVMPIGAAYLIHEGVWQLSFPVLTAISGVTMMLWLTMSFGEADDRIRWPAGPSEASDGIRSKKLEQEREPKHSYNRKAIPFLLFGVLFFMIYVGLEMSYSNYLASFMIERTGTTDTNATSVLSLFWTFMVIGRLFAGPLADRIGFALYIVMASVGSILVLTLSVFTMSFNGLVIWTCLAGLAMSGLFAVALVYANSRITGMTDRTTSLMVAAGGIGGAVFPRVAGWLMDSYGTTTTMWMIAGLAAAMLAVFLMMAVSARRTRQGDDQEPITAV
ncbi:MFS transporter [Paenibacillus xylaniclasticus]|uniref:MFS transporter n=1 Tax=Paenibacillus xylaniclasticus TaxID=588083 RepID=UPI000FD922BD|nr:MULTISPECIES: MFS transporter [Paenibacillus]GFN33937.1 putative glucose/mannose:H+ symporter GlcP [Paenibacillus curdlanolyticus]